MSPMSIIVFLSHRAADLPEAILVQGQGSTPQFIFQKIQTFSWFKALGPHRHTPNSQTMFVALIELTLLPGAGYLLHTWSTPHSPPPYSHIHKGNSFVRVLSLTQYNLPFHVPRAFSLTIHTSAVDQYHLPQAISKYFCLNTLMPSSKVDHLARKKVFMWQGMCRPIWLFHLKIGCVFVFSSSLAASFFLSF